MDFMKKDLALIKTVLSSVMTLTGILTIVFSILCLADIKDFTPDTALRYIAGISLIVSGVIIIVLNLCKETHKIDIRDSLAGGILIALGVFFVMKESSDALKSIIMVMLPLIIACVGGAILIKGSVALLTMKNVNEEEKKGLKVKSIFLIFFGTIFLVTGILFCIFGKKDKVYDVIWLIAGLIISCVSIVVLIPSARDLKKFAKAEKSNKKPKVENKKDEDVVVEIKSIEEKVVTPEENSDNKQKDN